MPVAVPFGLLVVVMVALAPARADEAAAWDALRAGGSVALMRHTDAPGGSGDPPGFKLGDCTTQRNLSEAGRAEAKAAGERLKAEGITIGRLASSPWCRCIDTARLMDIGTVEIEPTFGNVVVLTDRREELTDGAREVIGAWKGPSTLLIVTHGANIAALTGRSPAQGEIVVVESSQGDIREIGRIPLPDG